VEATTVLGDTLPLAIAIAASPFPVLPAILLLFSPRPRAASLSFLGGWIIGILVPTTVFVLLSEIVEASATSPRWVSWVRVVLGIALVAYGVQTWLTRTASSEGPAWMRSVESATPAAALRLALLLTAANPKVLLIAAAAGATIGSGDVHGWAEVAAVVAFAAVASVSVAVPVLSYLIAGDRLLTPLSVAKDWLTSHNAGLMAVVLIVLGLLVLSNGISGLR
jgi:threonine/homoserine/homoserine lactone efflux protein